MPPSVDALLDRQQFVTDATAIATLRAMIGSRDAHEVKERWGGSEVARVAAERSSAKGHADSVNGKKLEA